LFVIRFSLSWPLLWPDPGFVGPLPLIARATPRAGGGRAKRGFRLLGTTRALDFPVAFTTGDAPIHPFLGDKSKVSAISTKTERRRFSLAVGSGYDPKW